MLTNLLSTYSASMSPTLVPSTLTPSSNYPSMSPSTVYIITTIAGTGSTTYSGDNGAATSAGLYYPLGAAIDSAGEQLFVLLSTILLLSLSLLPT